MSFDHNAQDDQKSLLTVAEFAARAKVTIRTVKRWAAEGIGPKPLRPPGARLVRYRSREVDEWLNGNPIAAREAQ